MEGHILPRVLCATCKHCIDQRTTKHDASGLCTECHKPVELMRSRQCLYYKPRKKFQVKDKSVKDEDDD